MLFHRFEWMQWVLLTVHAALHVTDGAPLVQGAVLAEVNGHAGLFRVNADRDLHAGSLFIERGAWRLLGLVVASA